MTLIAQILAIAATAQTESCLCHNCKQFREIVKLCQPKPKRLRHSKEVVVNPAKGK